MRKEACFFIGTISNLFSFKGEILAKVETDYPKILLNTESIFVEFGQNLVPYIVLDSRWHKRNLLRLKLEDVADEHAARALVGKDLYLPKKLFPKPKAGDIHYPEFIDYEVVDANSGETIGIITAVNQQSAQALFIVEHPQGKELLLPIADELIAKIDRVEHLVFYQTPQGLLELFLE